ncbi:chemotaxis protein CheR [Rhodocytophaga rosea]|uniref:Chemotaxis protein CheR n=1 Tax=Rhodocytophaga rosea TaxID=2704465 RepID=A0A6C0GBT8_9BACT|nr:CheR family methyltransferase [Rhodocytophaga rosea]QHT65293.1 chemotaxis protein CheR [Rhodocytophaga rosea]
MNNTLPQQYIIAIGTSAGGLEELESFFDHTFPDGVSYVIVQHLSADYKSILAQIIRKHSKLEICEAQHEMPVEVNKVYTIPYDKYMTIRQGMLYLSNKLGTVAPHFTIDTFFKSLAAERGNKAIGIILTGKGTDGTRGIKAIHKAGGIVLAQDPFTASYREMPDSAIATGFTNKVLSVQAMPKAIEEFVSQYADGFISVTAEDMQMEEVKDIDETILVAIIKLIKDHVPHDFSGYKRGTIKRRIYKRMAATQLDTPEAYVNYLSNHPEELESLSQDLLIHVTAFFRDQEEFAYLETTIIPDIIKLHPAGETLKIWCAGCATGEEAYSIAILIKEYLDKTGRQVEVKIFATDIDKKVISIASAGVYPESISGDVSQERLKNYFTLEGDSYKVKPGLRKMLIFATHDLAQNPPYCHMSLISCRNVLIYMKPVLQKKVLSMLSFGLQQGGYLFLGSSENTRHLGLTFAEVNKKWKVYKKTGISFEKAYYSFVPPILEDLPAIAFPDIATGKPAYFKHNFTEDINEVVLHASGYAGVCLDHNLNILHTFGDLSPYLLPKVLNFNLSELLPRALLGVFGAAAHRSIKHNERVVLKRMQIKEESSLLINVLIEPFVVRKTGQKLIVVLFSEEQKGAKEEQTQLFDPVLHIREYISDMEAELKEARENLQQVFEKIESFNEKRQPLQEELLSANEEMQSANEELQSLNEELQTINTEHKQKIKELTELNDDFNNYFSSNVNRQLFVDKNLLLKKFSPATFNLINLKESDLGRPISEITSNLQPDTLVENLKKVNTTGEVLMCEVQDKQEKWYQVVTMPYVRQISGQQDGAIVTFTDITRLKHAQEEVDQSNESLKRINADLDNFVYAASHDLLGPLSTIEGLINLIKTDVEADSVKTAEYHRMLDDSIHKFKEAIKELASVGKIESEMLQEQENKNISALLSDIKLSILDKIISSRVSIVENLQIPEIRFSKKNLRSILYNLISNAIKFTSPQREPQIVISTLLKDGFVQLNVADNGIGMEEAHIASVFTMYRRLNKHIEGQGIGLYLVKKIIDAAGGKIEISSELNKGTSICIFFKR